ncbi:MAG: hypothetical protein O7C67_02565 [Gammaproteobacteria bacterium]|nr:hypothetical protein [Gammaproteobacteria bacterium]
MSQPSLSRAPGGHASPGTGWVLWAKDPNTIKAATANPLLAMCELHVIAHMG